MIKKAERICFILEGEFQDRIFQCRSIQENLFSIQFMEGPLLNGLYWEYAYNKGNKKTRVKHEDDDSGQ